jgi:hypothetical protein
MSARRIILRELSKRHAEGGNGYTRPGAIAGFEEQPGRYQEAVNKLLQERLINGTKDAEGRLAIAINTHRLADVQKELRPWYARAATWVVALGAAVAVAIFIVLTRPPA